MGGQIFFVHCSLQLHCIITKTTQLVGKPASALDTSVTSAAQEAKMTCRLNLCDII